MALLVMRKLMLYYYYYFASHLTTDSSHNACGFGVEENLQFPYSAVATKKIWLISPIAQKRGGRGDNRMARTDCGRLYIPQMAALAFPVPGALAEPGACSSRVSPFLESG